MKTILNFTTIAINVLTIFNSTNHKNYNFLDYDWFKKLLFFTNSFAKLLSNGLLLNSLLPDSSIS